MKYQSLNKEVLDNIIESFVHRHDLQYLTKIDKGTNIKAIRGKADYAHGSPRHKIKK